MKLSGLILGGIVGAAATMYVSRKRPDMAARASGAVADMCASAAGKAFSMMAGRARMNSEAMKSAPKPSADTAATSAAAWERIESFIESDPSVKREVDKIKAEKSAVAH
ncbi:hypothetical protein [Paenibacillus sp. PAMC21692]|uniref:hypothetical protein n=1 Tax=Paenibacillus sp. PAMC21692 TaxID=2762320 RepID=UPI00164D7B58|nr:hypothetical protein [Paenibacillus sp. PAMC21692]QNK55394.1 hypothetical protein H7F31_22630 [Paenibacillus sp. PAMC21692]